MLDQEAVRDENYLKMKQKKKIPISSCHRGVLRGMVFAQCHYNSKKKSASEAHIKTAVLPLAHQPVSHRTEMWVSSPGPIQSM